MSGSGNHTKKRNVPKGLQANSSNLLGSLGGLESVSEMNDQLESIQQVRTCLVQVGAIVPSQDGTALAYL
jgi:hypothetical protein